jgi:hypothetical protein
MLRRFRERRALRTAGKQANMKTHLNNVKLASSSNAELQQPIFRSAAATVPSIQPALTMGLSVDEDEVFVEETSQVFGSTKADKTTEMNATNVYDLRNVMDTDWHNFERIVAEKDEELFIMGIELGFLKEAVTLLENELKQTQTKVGRQNIEISIAKIALKYQEEELRYIKANLESESSTRKELQSTLEATQTLLFDRDEEVKSLQKSVQLCNRSAQMLAGFLTLGAMVTTDK